MIKICDFGFARTYCDKMATTAGTITEADQKILKGKLYDATADLYSLGCILYFLKYGRKLYQNEWETYEELVSMVEEHEFELDTPLNNEIENKMNNLIMKLLKPSNEQPMNWRLLRNDDFVCSCMYLVKNEFDLKIDYSEDCYFGEVVTLNENEEITEIVENNENKNEDENNENKNEENNEESDEEESDEESDEDESDNDEDSSSEEEESDESDSSDDEESDDE